MNNRKKLKKVEETINKKSSVIKLLATENRHKLDINSVGTIYYGGRDWALYGTDNLFPQHIVDITIKSSTNQSIINTKQYLTFGDGIDTDVESVNSKNESLSDIVKKACNDYILFGGFALWVGYDNKGKINKLKHIDFTKVRSGFANEFDEVGEYFIRNDWSVQTYRAKKDNTVITIPAFNIDNWRQDKNGQLFYFYKETPGIDYYPLPDWIGAKEEVLVDYELSNYLAAILTNAYLPKNIISILGENTDEENKLLFRDLAYAFRGTDNAGKPLVISSGQDENKVGVETLDHIIADPQYKEFVATVTSKIVNAHRIPRVIAGIETATGFSNTADEIRTAFELFLNTVITDYQKEIKKAFSRLGFNFEFIPIDIIKASLSEEALLKVLTINEVREMYGFEALKEEELTIDEDNSETESELNNTNNTENDTIN